MFLMLVLIGLFIGEIIVLFGLNSVLCEVFCDGGGVFGELFCLVISSEIGEFE